MTDSSPNCVSAGDLRALIDGELDEFSPAGQHVSQCADCQSRRAEMRDATSTSARLMANLQLEDEEPDVQQALFQYRKRSNEADSSRTTGGFMPRHLWRKRSARMATGIASLFAVIMLLTLSPMSSVADNFIDQFRVRKFEAITIDFNQFQAFGMDTMFSDVQGNPDALKATLSSLGDYSTTFNQDDPWANLEQYDSVDEAQAAYGDFDVAKDVPEEYAVAPEIYASDPGSVTVNVNTAEVQALIDDIGLPIFSLPDAATNPVLTFTMDVPSGIVQHFAGPDKDSHIVVAQMPSPTLTTPASLDMNNLREDVLAIPGLPPDFVAQLRSIKDWQETLVIPVPQGVSSDDVTINGQPGLSFTEDDGSGSAVLWQDNGALHIVGGTESLDVIRDIADSLD